MKCFHFETLILTYFRKVLKCGKLDSYSGSETRKFISFQLGEEKNGQPAQESGINEPEENSVQAVAMETNLVTPSEQSVQQAESMDQGAAQLQHSPSQSLISRFATDSSGSNESCGNYITCKISQMEEAAARAFAEVTETAQREIISEEMEVTLSAERPTPDQTGSPGLLKVVILDPSAPEPNNTHPAQAELLPKRPLVTPSASGSSIGTATFLPGPSAMETQQGELQGQDNPVTNPPSIGDLSESDFGRVSDSESGQNAGSTLADELKTVPECNLPRSSDLSSVGTPVNLPGEPREVPLGGRSRASIKEHFETSERVRLPPGHPVAAFTESQISAVMRVVADETARASYDMLENLVYRASRLSLASRPGSTKVTKQGSSRRGSSVVTSAGRNRSSSSEGYSDTSGALRSNDDLGSLGYSFEHSDLGSSTGTSPFRANSGV